MPRRARRGWGIVLLPVALVACAAGSIGVPSGGGDSSRLTPEDLKPYEGHDVYAVIQQLRGGWLNARMTGSFGIAPRAVGSESQIQVYVDGVRARLGIRELRLLRVIEVREIRHLDGRSATMLYGSDHGAGAILVVTRT